jgi:hypothetical protein
MSELIAAPDITQRSAAIHDLRRAWQTRLLPVLAACVVSAAAQAAATEYRLPLEQTAPGQNPAGWVAAATHPGGPLAQWQAAIDTASPGREKLLTIVRIQDRSPGVFNLDWTRQVAFQDGELKVRMRANSGKEDQGGGLIWRVRDENNYYVARYNPLESNFRLYYVKDGSRTTLASRESLSSLAGQWVQLRVTHHGRRIQGWLDETLAWDVNDAQFPDAGGVGLWSKADAASSFADFVVHTTPGAKARQ